MFEPWCAHHPVVRYRTWVGAFAFFPRNAAFRQIQLVSVSVSGERKVGICAPVSALKISVPRSSGDRFDDWLVGPQFEPYCLHHSSFASLTVPASLRISAQKWELSRFASVSKTVSATCSADFYGSVPALRISVPGGRDSGANPTAIPGRTRGFRGACREGRRGPRSFRVETEGFELPAPFRRRIAKPFHADAAGQATFYGCLDKVGCQEGE